MSSQDSHPISYRSDIDGLRALAILPVVLFHAFPNLLPGGFIGVDIFFVISGYLITSILLKDIQAGNYSIKKFYARRVRRIFPALSVVLVFCLALGWVVLTAVEYRALGKHAAGGAGAGTAGSRHRTACRALRPARPAWPAARPTRD